MTGLSLIYFLSAFGRHAAGVVVQLSGLRGAPPRRMCPAAETGRGTRKPTERDQTHGGNMPAIPYGDSVATKQLAAVPAHAAPSACRSFALDRPRACGNNDRKYASANRTNAGGESRCAESEASFGDRATVGTFPVRSLR